MGERELGQSGLRVPAIGLGCMTLSEVYGPVDDERSLTVLRRAHELGVRLFDTADVYGHGHNERLLSRFLADYRDDVVLATKCGIVPAAEQPGGRPDRPVRNEPEYIRSACEASLQRLGTDCIDLYYLHRHDPEIPIEEPVGAMARLVEEGKVRGIGLSEVSSENIRRAATEHPIAAVQSEYSLWTRGVEGRVLPVCRELGIGFVPFSPLGRGFLTGRIRSVDDLDTGDHRRENPRFAADNLEANLSLVDAVQGIAGRKGATSAQIALAWVLSRGDDIVPIPGTKTERYLEDNVAAADIVLDAEDLQAIDEIFRPGAVQGARYGEAALRMSETDTGE